MSEDSMLKCLIAFILGFLVSRMIRGSGLMVGGKNKVRQDLLRERSDINKQLKQRPNNKNLQNRLLKIDEKITKFDRKMKKLC